MKKTINQKLFFRINKQIGSKPLLDRFMRFCGHDLIYILTFVVFMWGTTVLFDTDPNRFRLFMKLLMTAAVFGFGTSWLIALIAPRRRPIREFPEKVQQLIEPLGTWKSFPSDHTIASFILAEMAIIFGAPLWFGSLLILSAMLIGFARVYVGVHYPRDVLGGIIVATIFSFASFFLLQHITEPLYSAFRVLFL